MKRYPEYKDGGVEWIGEIPKHWKYSRLKFHLTENSGGVWGKDDEFGNGTYVLRSTEITIAGNWDLQRLIKRKLSKEETEKFLLKKYDLVITKSSGSQDHIGKTGLVDEKIESMFVCYSNFVQRICPKNHINSKFLHYFMNCPLAREQYKYQSETTTGLANLSTKSIDELLIPLPPIHEQHQITKFLDSKTEQIDELIHIKERQIELLQEQCTALINQVVTKGLAPNVEMKPSGVEWIGEIPVHWETIPIKHTLQTAKDSIRAGPFGSSLKSHEFRDKGIRVYNQQSVYNEDFSKSDVFISEEKFNELRSFIVQPKDVLVTSRGTIGKMTIVPKNGEIGVLHPCLIRLRLNENKLIPKYLWWYVNHSSFFIESVKIASNSTTIEVIYTETLSSVKIPIPTVKEQLEIVEFLNVKIPMIDTTISNEQKKIELLKEYRQSLISEAVTGKIDVRNEV